MVFAHGLAVGAQRSPILQGLGWLFGRFKDTMCGNISNAQLQLALIVVSNTLQD